MRELDPSPLVIENKLACSIQYHQEKLPFRHQGLDHESLPLALPD